VYFSFGIWTYVGVPIAFRCEIFSWHSYQAL
jgi:hypothetical protein